MRALATKPQRLALGIAVLTAVALGTVSASAAQSAGTRSTDVAPAVRSVSTVVQDGGAKGTSPGRAKHPKQAAFAVAYHPTDNAPDDVNAANDDFAACMREQGQTSFPDFHAGRDEEGRVRLDVKVDSPDAFDPTSKSYEKALQACAPILAEAGITFPDPANLPPLPEPGQPGDPDDGEPSLHRRTESA
ncbi:hypothetical protein DI272_13980 [Streptomyces sp. Act143]|uniref:hypothetical protein n=1 Tax=Streptomyces sp. Act143 TaxID=2200760 RepID=UPI000D673E76|nr:hypothetical protein [Streptomyces sp. Act143]PWI15151.1 hypothetical protein DI272_13980 [Streptomyces sp. Act143]